jgi:hypothetical protein
VSPRHPAPREFPARPFRVSEALAHGIPAKRLRAQDLAAPFRGVRTTNLARLTLRERCQAFATRMPEGAAISHGTAALLHGLQVPLRLEHERALHVSVPEVRRAVAASGIVGHQLRLRSDDVDRRFGLPVTTPERTWCDLAATLELAELVALGDQLVHWELSASNRAALTDAVAAYPGRRGIRKLRHALELLSEFAESPRESMLRVALVLAGLPTPEVNREIFDARGRFVARVDLSYPAQRPDSLVE